jgi:hypothetical protein
VDAAFKFLAMAEACVDFAKGEQDAVRHELLELAEMLLDLFDEEFDAHLQRQH